MNNPRFPLYIPSKGRYQSNRRLTTKALQSMGVPFKVVVEEQEYKNYCDAVGKDNVLVLDRSYQDNYETFDNLGDSKSKGPGAARNFAWDHSIANGHEFHWVMDDNIISFRRWNKNKKLVCKTGAFFRAQEDFVTRYENVAMAGPHYDFFAPSILKRPPMVFNTRVYSCNLIMNKLDFRWRGRYNEDTDLSLQMLKAGYCTIQFYAFLQQKVNTQKVKGGNTAEFYAKEGTLPKSQMQVAMHPDVSKVVYKFGRWHHHVDYRPFKSNKLIKKKNIEIKKGIDNFGMELKHEKEK